MTSAAQAVPTSPPSWWPAAVALTGPAGPRLVRRGLSRSTAGWSLLPGSVRPRLLLPAPAKAASGALAAYRRAASGRVAALRAADAVAATGLIRRVLPALLDLEPDGGVDAWLSATLGEPLVSAARLGPPRANQKPVLHVLTADGLTRGFGKLGTGELTDRLVQQEVVALQRLVELAPTSMHVPELLVVGRHGGHPALVATALPLGIGPEPGVEALAPVLDELAALGPRHAVPLAASVCWGRLVDEVARLPTGASADRLRQDIADVARLVGDRQVRTGAAHGDFTPWNVAGGPVVSVWDWERFEPDSIWGLDAAHYLTQRRIVGQRQDPAVVALDLARSATAALGPWGVPAAQASVVAATYLLYISTRYLRDQQRAAGARLGDVGTWALPAVEHLVAGWSRRDTS